MQQVNRIATELLTTSPPHLTRQHFIMLADELAYDKMYYNSPISYHEKLNRMVSYCMTTNHRFNITSFKKRIDKTYNSLVKNLEKSVGGTI